MAHVEPMARRSAIAGDLTRSGDGGEDRHHVAVGELGVELLEVADVVVVLVDVDELVQPAGLVEQVGLAARGSARRASVNTSPTVAPSAATDAGPSAWTRSRLGTRTWTVMRSCYKSDLPARLSSRAQRTTRSGLGGRASSIPGWVPCRWSGTGSRASCGRSPDHHVDRAGRAASDLPAAFVAGDVMAAAQQREVLEVGGATVGPVHEMIRVAPVDRRRAPWEHAPAISTIERSAHGPVHQARELRPRPRISDSPA